VKDLILDKDKIRELMKLNSIRTQTELAERIGITKNQLSVVLSKSYNPVKSTVINLCKELKCKDFNDIIVNYKNTILKPSCTVKNKKNDKLKKSINSSNEFVNVDGIVPKKKYSVIELFAGAGGLALGLEKAGFETKALIEYDKYCCNTLRENRPKWNVVENDITKVVENDLNKFLNYKGLDLLSGGFPCQAFSYAGKKLGLEDVRGTMFYYYAEILKELKPKMFLAENVRGLISHDNGRTLKTIVNVFEEIGYAVSYKLLNAVNYGVAQKRERIVIIGIRNDLKKFIHKYPLPFEKILTIKDVLKDVPKSVGAVYPIKKKKVLDLVPPGGYWRDLPDEVAKEYMGVSYYSGGGRTGMARRISWDEPSLTLTCSPAQKQTERCHPEETRPFTVREYARIQGFPDEWNFNGSMAVQYKQIGNAVPVNFAKVIGLSIINTLNSIHTNN